MYLKKLVCFFAFLLIAGSLYAQFANPKYIDSTNTTSGARKITGIDVNRDGLKDLLILNQAASSDFVKLYLQDNNHDFSLQALPALDALESLYINSGDVDGDGFADLLIVQNNHHEITWYKNDGNGLSQKNIINDSTDHTSHVFVRDMDKDGWNDIVSLEHNEIVIYWQAANLDFSNRQVIHDGTEFYSLCLSDVNDDGYEDVLTGSGGFEVLLNQKNRAFNLLNNSWGISLNFNIVSADIDSDGDQDVLTWETLQGVYVYYNDGTGTHYTRDTVFKATDNFHSILIADANNDSLPDVITSLGQLGKILVFYNDLQKGFSNNVQLHRQQGAILYQLYQDDFNNDQKADVVWAERKVGILFSKPVITGVYTEMKNESLSVFPNPSTSEMYIRNFSSDTQIYNVYDLMGNLILKDFLLAGETQNLSIPHAGMYLLKTMNANSELKIIKIIKN